MSLHLSEMLQLQQLLQRLGQPGQGQVPQFAGQVAPQALSIAAPEGFVRPPIPVGTTPGSPGFVPPQGAPQGLAEFQHGANQAAQGNPSFSGFGTAAALQDFAGKLGQEQGARNPAADADLQGKLAGITQQLARQQKQFSQFGKAQRALPGQFGRFAGGRGLGVNAASPQRRVAPRAQGISRAVGAGQRAEDAQRAATANRGVAKQQRRTENPIRQSQQAKQPRRGRVRQGIKSGLARLRSRFER